MFNKDQFSKKSQVKTLVISVLIISFLVGGITGGVVGAIAGGIASDSFIPWFKESILGQKSGSTFGSEILGSQTLKVEEESATVEVVEKVSPSVVSIIITKDLSKIYNLTGPDLFPFGFPGFEFSAPEGKQEVGGGTGFIISSDGMILTNKHVVSDTEAEYSVILNDGTRYDNAKILATDPFNDIAVVKIEAKNLSVVELGDSDNLKIGQTVIAIGNTLSEYRNTVTKGIISGIGRTITAGGAQGQSETLEGVIQTDAAINPGNSGGPLINLVGQVIGINTAINLEGQLIGFAIPVNIAKEAIESVEKTGRIIRPMIGIRYALVTQRIAEVNNLPVDYGALVIRGEEEGELAVIPDSPADKSGIVENDIILEINGQRIDSEHTLAHEIKKYKVGDMVTLKILHEGKEKEVTIKLEELK